MKKVLVSFLVLSSSLFTFCEAQYTDLLNFNTTDARNGYGGLTLNGNKLYGMTKSGYMGGGSIFSVNTNGSGYTDLFDFNGITGGNALGSLTLFKNKFYGMTEGGGANGAGVVFSIDTDGSGYRDLWDFKYLNATNGAYPYGNVIIANGKLYGMTYQGGGFTMGNVFCIDTDGSNYKDLLDFDGTNGIYPYGSLILSGHTLFGMTSGKGSSSYGNVFSVDTNGSGYKQLFSFDGLNGEAPMSDLTQSGNVLYGVTELGVFAIDTDGTGFRNITGYGGTNYIYSTGVLILSGNTLYGTSPLTGYGTIYSINTDGSGFTLINSFANGIYGQYPVGPLTLSGSKFYGIAVEGGAIINGPGCIFSLDTLLNATAAAGGSITCYGENDGTVSANTTGDGAPYTYQWSPGGGSNSFVTGLSAGTYTVKITNTYGFSVTAATTITQPAAMIITHDSTAATSGCNGIAGVSVGGGASPYTYTWGAGQTTDTVHGCAGLYCCTITDKNGCTQSTCITIKSSPAGIDNSLSKAERITVYPNPNNGKFTIQSSVPGGQYSVEVYNVLGKKVYSQFATFDSQLLINLSSQPNGIYLYRVTSNSGELIGEGKMIIQK